MEEDILTRDDILRRIQEIKSTGSESWTNEQIYQALLKTNFAVPAARLELQLEDSNVVISTAKDTPGEPSNFDAFIKHDDALQQQKKQQLLNEAKDQMTLDDLLWSPEDNDDANDDDDFVVKKKPSNAPVSRYAFRHKLRRARNNGPKSNFIKAFLNDTDNIAEDVSPKKRPRIVQEEDVVADRALQSPKKKQKTNTRIDLTNKPNDDTDAVPPSPQKAAAKSTPKKDNVFDTFVAEVSVSEKLQSEKEKLNLTLPDFFFPEDDPEF